MMLTSKKTNNYTKKHENNHQLLPETAIAANSAVIIAGPSADEIKT